MASKGPNNKPSYFRSEEMSLCQLYVKKDTVYSCICELGELGLVQFNNLGDEEKMFQLMFARQAAYCAEMDRVIRFLQNEVKWAEIPLADVTDEDVPLAPQYKEMADLRTILDNIEQELSEIIKNYELLQQKYVHLMETNAVLEKADEFFMDASILAWSDSLTMELLHDTNDLRASAEARRDEGPKLGYLTGTIPMETFFIFERILWRVCRGNYYIRHTDIRSPQVESLEKKFVFMVFFQGEVMEAKIRKICQGFQTTLYQCPESSHDRMVMMEMMDSKISDLQIVLKQTDYHRRRVLEVAARDLPFWRIRVKKVMAVYHVMNQMDMGEGDKYLIAECWIPTADIPLIQQTLYKAAISVGSTVPPIIARMHRGSKIPPTYNKTNRVLRGFQHLIDAYGIANYRELNPSPYTMVTFPFLFAVMFGDFGHGIIMAVFAGWMVKNEIKLEKKKIDSEIWEIIFAGRYIILSMGLFSIYTGLIYNDIFSKSIKVIDSAWKVQHNESTVLSTHLLILDPRYDYRRHPYQFGLDPIWDASGEAAIIMLNSFKMKVAIILGVAQMFFGMLLSAKNHLFFHNYIDLFGMCIPQMLFFSLFLYLVALIFMKWSWYSANNPQPYDTHCAPSILIIFIDMLLFKRQDSEKIDEGCQEFMYENQLLVQRCMVFVALVCIPIMLLAKPVCVMIKRNRAGSHLKALQDKRNTYNSGNRSKRNGNQDGMTVLMPDEEDSSSSTHSQSTETETTKMDHSENAELSEIFIDQAIHTIEAVLGAVSHTASYLRLWALSLAHDQLSTVLWNMVLVKGLKVEDWTGGVILVFAFSVWAVLTIAILVVMEGLSAFLHTLRLHWVEFQSKFYTGSGTPFQPFDFKRIISMDSRAD